jgi:DNA-binding response OmpR family regulator
MGGRRTDARPPHRHFFCESVPVCARFQPSGSGKAGPFSAFSRLTVDAPLLVVDDDPSIREFLALTLRLGGYEVVFAEDGEPVPDIVASQSPQLVIMDLAMPGVSGLDALRNVRAMGSTVPVIMLTAHGEDEDKLAAFEAGADDYLVKPFSGRELVARVGAVLRRARLPHAE